jgi:DNA-binding NtrC family response regulator
MRKTFEEIGLRVIEASSGTAAMQLLNAGGPATIGLVLSDIVMPGFPGNKLAARVAEEWSEVPVLLVSGFGMKAGCAAPALAKPFTPEGLLRAVDELLIATQESQWTDTSPA